MCGFAMMIMQEKQFKKTEQEQNNDEWILKNISFTIEPGTTTAVGATGAGKSTLPIFFCLLIFIKEKFMTALIYVCSSRMVRNVAIVLQDVFLFSRYSIKHHTWQ